jgi:hypothetical protein
LRNADEHVAHKLLMPQLVSPSSAPLLRCCCSEDILEFGLKVNEYEKEMQEEERVVVT